MSVAIASVLESTRTASDHSLAELSNQHPVLIVFLRHSGCPYCRQTLRRLSKLRSTLQSRQIGLVIVHHDTAENGAAWIAKYNLGECEQISDPEGQLYGQFELGKTNWWNLAGPHTWWPGFKATILQLNGVGKPVGDIKQLTGAFIIHRGKIIKSFRQKMSHQSPDYNAMVCEL
jgi:peroxiredoxin